MAFATIEDACYWVDILEKVLIEEMTSLNPLRDPLKACLVGACKNQVEPCPNNESRVNANILNSVATYFACQRHEASLSVETQSSKDEETRAP